MRTHVQLQRAVTQERRENRGEAGIDAHPIVKSASVVSASVKSSSHPTNPNGVSKPTLMNALKLAVIFPVMSKRQSGLILRSAITSLGRNRPSLPGVVKFRRRGLTRIVDFEIDVAVDFPADTRREDDDISAANAPTPRAA